MYDSILVTLDATPTDRAIIEHIKLLAKVMHSRVVLLHVADGWAARTFGKEAVSPEVDEDKAYLAKVRSEFESEGIKAEAELAFGDPAAGNRSGMGRAERLRSGGDEHAWPSLPGRPVLRRDRHPRAAQMLPCPRCCC